MFGFRDMFYEYPDRIERQMWQEAQREMEKEIKHGIRCGECYVIPCKCNLPVQYIEKDKPLNWFNVLLLLVVISVFIASPIILLWLSIQ